MNVARVSLVLAIATIWLTAPAGAQSEWAPARYEQGSVPPTPVMAVAGGEVFLEVTVMPSGTVGGIDVLRTTPPFTDEVLNVVRGWRFKPAEQRVERASGGSSAAAMTPVESRVLVAAVFLPPSLNTPTLGIPAEDVSTAQADTPAPREVVVPPFPLLAQFDGTVLVEVRVRTDGRVTEAKILESSAGFDEVGLEAARQWTFEPARIRGRVEETFAYIMIAFRQPITNQRRR